MKKLLYTLLVATSAHFAYADNAESAILSVSKTAESTPPAVVADPVLNSNAEFINRTAYIQNPYTGIPSGGGTLQAIQTGESQNAIHGFWKTLLTEGTYNVYAGMTGNLGNSSEKTTTTQWPNNNDITPYSYGANIFGQTGQIGGFSLGGLVTAMNPLFANQMNGDATQHSDPNFSIYTPSYSQIGISEAFLEYQYSNILNADIGYIAIDNSPWLGGTYFNNQLTMGNTYQGALVNLYAGGGWLLTGLAFNAAQYGAQMGFTGAPTITSFNTANGGTVANNIQSNGTASLGANYSTWDNNYNLRLWGYQFDNYGSIFYADNSLNIPINKSLSLNVAGQFGTDQQLFQNSSAVSQLTGQAIQSYFAGLKGGLTYDWFVLNLSANTTWGPSSAYGGGSIVTPYTSALNLDPLYSEGWSTNMATSGFTGWQYKAGTQFNFFSNNLSLQPAYIYVNSGNQQWNGTQEMDMLLNYSIPQVKGLFVFAVYANQWLPEQNPNGSNAWTSELGVFYTY